MAFEVTLDERVRITKSLVVKHLSLPRLKHERTLNRQKVERIKRAIKNGTFRFGAVQWVYAYLLATGLKYSLNGQHTATAFYELIDSGEMPEGFVNTMEYLCESQTEINLIYSEIDRPEQGRKDSHVIGICTASMEDLEGISFSKLGRLKAGFGRWMKIKSLPKLTAFEMAEFMRDNYEFCQWWSNAFSAGHGENTHVVRGALIAALFEIYKCAGVEPLDAFFKPLVEPSVSGTVTQRLLLKYVMSASASKQEDIREMYCKTIDAFNAFSEGRDLPFLRYYPSSKISEVNASIVEAQP